MKCYYGEVDGSDCLLLAVVFSTLAKNYRIRWVPPRSWRKCSMDDMYRHFPNHSYRYSAPYPSQTVQFGFSAVFLNNSYSLIRWAEFIGNDCRRWISFFSENFSPLLSWSPSYPNSRPSSTQFPPATMTQWIESTALSAR